MRERDDLGLCQRCWNKLEEAVGLEGLAHKAIFGDGETVSVGQGKGVVVGVEKPAGHSEDTGLSEPRV